MKAFSLVVLLVGSGLCAPQREARQRQAPVLLQNPQYGSKLSQGPTGAQVVYLQGGYQQPQYYQGQQVAYQQGGYQQPQYYQGQQVAYLQGGYQQPQYYQGQHVAYLTRATQQSSVSSTPAQTLYSGASNYFTQPQANLVAVQKTVKPSVYQVPQVSYRPPVVTTYKSQSPGAYTAIKASAPVSSHTFAPATPIHKSASLTSEPYHVIVKQAHDDNFDGSFNYNYETDNGIAVESSGFVKNAGTEDEVQVIQGSYTYYSPEGLPITTTYIADENGFQVQGDHLPVAPPLPEAIAKSIEYQRSLPPSVEDQEPSTH